MLEFVWFLVLPVCTWARTWRIFLPAWLILLFFINATWEGFRSSAKGSKGWFQPTDRIFGFKFKSEWRPCFTRGDCNKRTVQRSLLAVGVALILNPSFQPAVTLGKGVSDWFTHTSSSKFKAAALWHDLRQLLATKPRLSWARRTRIFRKLLPFHKGNHCFSEKILGKGSPDSRKTVYPCPAYTMARWLSGLQSGS